MSSPSELLVGLSINGWQVLNQRGIYPGMTGGNFSTGYVVEKDGKQAFMKAMDLHGVIAKGMQAIADTATQFTFEKDILSFCSDQRLSGVIRLLEAGETDPGQSGNPMNIIYYMIFELADGDIRRELTFAGTKLDSWKLKVLHQATKALVQLHSVEIAHQDLKPSNVLSFETNQTFKLGDLGRSTSKRFRAPADAYPFPGDLGYAPPEYHYGYVTPDYHDRRLGSDAYLLGSLLSFLFGGSGALVTTLWKLPNSYKPDIWQGSYQDVLPFLISAHTEVTQLLSANFSVKGKSELAEAYFYLCHPDPSERGHPDARRQTGRPIGLDRYRSIFDRLMKRSEVDEKMACKGVVSA